MRSALQKPKIRNLHVFTRIYNVFASTIKKDCIYSAVWTASSKKKYWYLCSFQHVASTSCSMPKRQNTVNHSVWAFLGSRSIFGRKYVRFWPTKSIQKYQNATRVKDFWGVCGWGARSTASWGCWSRVHRGHRWISRLTPDDWPEGWRVEAICWAMLGLVEAG